VLPADILKSISFIDTPGVLSGSKQRIGRDYNFSEVCAWMAERADMVLLCFDAHKLDISDEFQEVLEVLRPWADKVRCVLNKADQIDAANLVRVYGALLWNTGKVLRTPEVARVFISSFWDQPYHFKDHQKLFDEDREAVIKELELLPRTALVRRINAFVARVRRLKAHLCVVCHLRDEMPFHLRHFGKNEWQLSWAQRNISRIFDEAMRLRRISPGDLPDLEAFKARMADFDEWSRLPPFSAQDVRQLDIVTNVDIPTVMGEVSGVTTSTTAFVNTPTSLARGGICSKRKHSA
jgi:EH domain-containing protein 1